MTAHLPFSPLAPKEYPETCARGKPSLAQKAELRRRAGNVCASCGVKPKHGWEYDHILELWETGTNKLDNFQALGSRKDCDCHAEKTAAAAKRRAKMRRLRGETGQRARRERNGPSMQSRGFAKKPEGYQHKWPKRKFGK